MSGTQYSLPNVDPGTYKKLVGSFYKIQANFMATVALTTDPYIGLEDLFQAMIPAYNLDVAIGKQLDVLGSIVGVSRQINEPIEGVYFSFGIAGLGWNQGLLKGPYDPIEGLVNLDDPTYRLLIEAKIAGNAWDGTLPGAMTVLYNLLGPNTEIFLQDNQDMSITVAVSGQTPSVLQWALITGGYVPLRPAGVNVSRYGVASLSNTPIFGFGANNEYIGGWGKGSFISSTLPT